MKKFLIALLISSVSIVFLHAQEDVSDWPPDSDIIFAEGVEVLSVEISENTQEAQTDSTSLNEPEISPDGKWVVQITVFNELINNQQIQSFDVYGYEIETEQRNYLGRIDYTMGAIYPPSVSYNWVSNTQGLISYGPPQESLSKSYYAFDTSQPDSLELVVQGWMYDFYYFRDNPPRYDYVETTGFISWKTGSYIPLEFGGCSFLRYDASGVQHHDLGFDCIGAHVGVGTDHNQLATLRLDSEPAEFSTLVTYDLSSREFTEILSGEIEWWFGGLYHYILLLMDDSGEIDLVNYYPYDGGIVGNYWWLGNIEGAYIAVFDTITGEFVYDSSSTRRVTSHRAVLAQWIGGDRFIYSLDANARSLTMVVLDEDGAHEYTVDNISQWLDSLRFAPDGYRMIAYIPQQNAIGIADFLSGEVYPLLNSNVTGDYYVSFEWIDSNTLNVRVRQEGDARSASAIYTVRIP